MHLYEFKEKKRTKKKTILFVNSKSSDEQAHVEIGKEKNFQNLMKKENRKNKQRK